MKRILCGCLITLAPLLTAIEIDSSQVDYNGKVLKLNGQVTVEHEMGTLVADEAVIIPSKDGYKSKDVLIKLKDNVKVTLHQGGVLTCPKAAIDYGQLTGTFYSNDDQKVVYVEKNPAIKIVSDQLILQLEEKEVSSITAQGQVSVTFEDKIGQQHLLKGRGNCHINHALQELTFIASEAEQIHFEDAYGTMQTDRLNLKYSVADAKLALNKLILEGQVSMLNKYRLAPELPQDQQQYALADKVEWNPSAQELSLSAQPPARVLFMDPANHLQVSAPALTLKRDFATLKEVIEGKGDVRFQFVNQEFDKLKQRFKIFPEVSE